MKNNLGAISKKLVAVLAIFTVFVYNLIPLTKVFASDAYTVTFTFGEGYSGEADNGIIVIHDSQNHDIFTELRTDPNDNNSRIGETSCSNDTCQITVQDGTPTYLSTVAPVSWDNGNPFNFDTQIAGNMNLVIQENQSGGDNPVNPQPQGATYNVNFGTASWVIGGTTVTASIEGKTINNSQNVEIVEQEVITLVNYDSSNMDVRIDGADNFHTFLFPANDGTVRLTDLEPGTSLPNSNLTFSIVERQEQPQPDQQGGEDDIIFDIEVTNTHMNAWINNKVIMDDSDEILKDVFVGTVEDAGTTDPNQTNVIRLIAPFGDEQPSVFTINDVDYTQDSAAVQVDQDGGFFITVPGASTYTIRATATGEAAVPRTIIWFNSDSDKTAAGYDEDMLLEHGKARVIAVYDEDDHLISPEQYIGNNSDQYGLDDKGFGWVTIRPNSKVVFEFVPEYGYQLTSVMTNGMALEPQDTINQYTFIMPDANIHFSAEFKKTEDIVVADSSKISEGTIELGETLDGGSAALSIKDIELDSNKIKNFEAAAGDYKIKNYLDIELYNIFYKGKDDINDAWANKIDELDDEATITIKLEDGIDGNDIVIVHNIHDGEEYEIIPTVYDKATNTITFKTRSFSNYAIASKTVTSASTSNVKTGDQIMIYVLLLGISLLGIMIVRSLKKRKVNVK